MIVLISGAIASGKTTLAEKISTALGLYLFRTRAWLQEEIRIAYGVLEPTREILVTAGKTLDKNQPDWLAKALRPLPQGGAVVDSVRHPNQVHSIRADKDGVRRVVHIHLDISKTERGLRLAKRGDLDSITILDEHDSTLAKMADLVLDVSRDLPQDTFARCWNILGLRDGDGEQNVDCIVGGQYGSEGKGHIVAHIAPEYDMLVRVGGPNAGHTVVHPQLGSKVSFYHIPSGALHNPTARLVLGPGACINPEVLVKEAAHLGGIYNLARSGRLFIDPQANVISTEDMAKEADLVASIGSTGQGVGVATADKILGRAVDRALARDHELLRKFVVPSRELFEEAHSKGKMILVEGTQGTGLSLHHGHYPYVTSRDTTIGGTLAEAGIAPHRLGRSYVVLRTFPIRVAGPSGPMGLETSWEEVAKITGSKSADQLREAERTTTTKRLRRVSWFSFADLQRAVTLNGPTDLALTFTDYLDDNQEARRFSQLGPRTQQLIEQIEHACGVQVTLASTGVHEGSVLDRRAGVRRSR